MRVLCTVGTACARSQKHELAGMTCGHIAVGVGGQCRGERQGPDPAEPCGVLS